MRQCDAVLTGSPLKRFKVQTGDAAAGIHGYRSVVFREVQLAAGQPWSDLNYFQFKNFSADVAQANHCPKSRP